MGFSTPEASLRTMRRYGRCMWAPLHCRPQLERGLAATAMGHRMVAWPGRATCTSARQRAKRVRPLEETPSSRALEWPPSTRCWESRLVRSAA